MSTLTEELKTYQGNCHCGAFKFHVTLPEVKSASRCNCSICSKKGYLWVFPKEEHFKIVRGNGTLKDYQFAKKSLWHKFCPTCGTAVMGIRSTAPPGMNMGINARTLMNLDVRDLDVNLFDGLNKLEPKYEEPQFKGEEPKVEGEGMKIYTGSCHCGAVTLAVKTKPIPEINVKEDNCSICQRNGYMLIYPSISQVTIVGAENTTAYQFGRKLVEHHFCKTCGIPLYMTIVGPQKEVLDSWPEERKKVLKSKLGLCPINIQVLKDVEWDKLTIEKCNEGTEGYSID